MFLDRSIKYQMTIVVHLHENTYKHILSQKNLANLHNFYKKVVNIKSYIHYFDLLKEVKAENQDYFFVCIVSELSKSPFPESVDIFREVIDLIDKLIDGRSESSKKLNISRLLRI